MFSFENLHKNKKLAFLDGLLSGAVIVGFVWYSKKLDCEYEEKQKNELRRIDESTARANSHALGVETGIETTLRTARTLGYLTQDQEYELHRKLL